MSEPKLGEELLIKFKDKIFAGITSHDGGWDRDMVETTNMNTPNKGRSYRPGRISGDLSIEVIEIKDESATTLDYYALLKEFKTGVAGTIIRGGSEPGEEYEEFDAFVKSVNKKASDNTLVTGSVTFQPQGVPDVKTVPTT